MTSRKFSLRCLAALPRFAVRHPGVVVLLALLVTMAAVPGLGQLKLRTDGHALVSEDDPVVRYDQLVRAQFGIEDHIVVLVQASPPDGIYNPATLQRVRELTAAFQRLPGVNASNIFSLATEPSLRLRPGTLQFQTLLETPRETKPQLGELREELRKIRLYTGTLVSYDGQSTAILIGAPGGSERIRLYRTIYQIIEQHPRTGDLVRIIGAPVAPEPNWRSAGRWARSDRRC